MKVKMYPYYQHRRDPVLDNLEGALNGTSYKEAAIKAGVGVGTLRNWWSKKAKRRTMRPKFVTVAAVARSQGEEGIKAVIDTIRKGR